MENGFLENYVAPCSLLCYTCAGYKEGIIAESARTLRHYLAGLEGFGSKERKAIYRTLFDKLEQYSSCSCTGCRNSEKKSCMIQGCIIPQCIQDKGISFCYQCEDFPCDLNDFEPEITKKWIEGSQRIAEVGVEQYFVESKSIPHYR